MVFKFISNIKNSEKGVTLIEIIVSIVIIAIFSLILIADFPKIQKQLALSRASYKLAQDLGSIRDLGLSGVQKVKIIGGADGSVVLAAAKGYGIYINPYSTTYILYADLETKLNDGTPAMSANQIFDFDVAENTQLCENLNNVNVNPLEDCIISKVDIKKENSDLKINDIKDPGNLSMNFVHINFYPPNPTVTIKHPPASYANVSIILGLKSISSATRTIYVNNSGLIDIR